LLKVLEEPPINTSFLLVSDQPRRLLPTLRSRCTRLDVGLPPQQDALQWLCDNEIVQAEEMLALSGGAPLKVLNWAETDDLAERSEILQSLSRPRSLDPVARAEAWKSVNPRMAIACKWLCDLMATRRHDCVLSVSAGAGRLGKLRIYSGCWN
jgi:DNA polymerase-3 subunit delta'